MTKVTMGVSLQDGKDDDGGVETREGGSGGDPSATMKLSLQDDKERR
jgi:hypothetical protein